MIPQTIDEWKNCIVQGCRISLTKDFASRRLVVYMNPDNPETQKFAETYGVQHLQRIIGWFDSVVRNG